MRRKDREVSDPKEVIDILSRCNTIHVGIQGDKYPYVVPLSFGMEVIAEKPVLYFHCARQGMKLDLLRQNPDVCVEAEIFMQIEKTAHGITARYESVIGFGRCTFLTDPDEIAHGLKLLTEHYGHYDYPLDRCRGLKYLNIGKIVLESITGKKNLPGSPTPADRAARAAQQSE